mgnify:CR=1 FL=1
MHGQAHNPLEDPDLGEYQPFLMRRGPRFAKEYARIQAAFGSLEAYASLYKELGVHLVREGGKRFWLWREYLPGAKTVWMTTEKLRFQRHAKFRFTPEENGFYRLEIPYEELCHGMYVELRIEPRDYEVFNEEVFMDICKFADDVWVNAMAIKSGIPIYRVSTRNLRGDEFMVNENMQDVGLFHVNTQGENLNDKQIEAVFTKYDLYEKLK